MTKADSYGAFPSADEIRKWQIKSGQDFSIRGIMRDFGIDRSMKREFAQYLKGIKATNSREKYVKAVIQNRLKRGTYSVSIQGKSDIVTFYSEADLPVGASVLLKREAEGFRLVRIIDHKPLEFLARFLDDREGGKLQVLEKGRPIYLKLAPHEMKLQTGDIVRAYKIPSKKHARAGLEWAHIVEKLGNEADRHMFSSMALRDYQLVDEFPAQALAEAQSLTAQSVMRKDWRDKAFLTIDPSDARDRDDAIYIEKLENGWQVYIAIADVAAYVSPQNALDGEAYRRGNSVYFPDRVIPMLPEALSNGVCSLHSGEDKNVLAAVLMLNEKGEMQDFRFARAVIHSQAALSYEEAQAIGEGARSHNDAVHEQIDAAFTLFPLLERQAQKRGVMALDLKEHEIVLTPEGRTERITLRERLTAHRLIEELMILANRAASEVLSQQNIPTIFRIHEPPKPEKYEQLRAMAQPLGIKLAKTTQPTSASLHQLIEKVKDTPRSDAINLQILRSMRQARYSPDNQGHFGLALKDYSHFTSPIRRYADLVLHRQLIAALGLGDDGYFYSHEALIEISDEISKSERIAMQAERDVKDRFIADYLSEFIGDEVSGRINGFNKAGLFITLDLAFADAFMPMRFLSDDHYRFDKTREILRGVRTGRVFALGQNVRVQILSAQALTGAVEVTLTEHEGKALKMDYKPRAGKKRKPSVKKSHKRKRT